MEVKDLGKQFQHLDLDSFALFLEQKDPTKRKELTRILTLRKGVGGVIPGLLSMLGGGVEDLKKGMSALDARKLVRSAKTIQKGPKAARVGSRQASAQMQAFADMASDPDFMSGGSK